VSILSILRLLASTKIFLNANPTGTISPNSHEPRRLHTTGLQAEAHSGGDLVERLGTSGHTAHRKAHPA
jgi:hypothetical protein